MNYKNVWFGIVIVVVCLVFFGIEYFLFIVLVLMVFVFMLFRK